MSSVFTNCYACEHRARSGSNWPRCATPLSSRRESASSCRQRPYERSSGFNCSWQTCTMSTTSPHSPLPQSLQWNSLSCKRRPSRSRRELSLLRKRPSAVILRLRWRCSRDQLARLNRCENSREECYRVADGGSHGANTNVLCIHRLKLRRRRWSRKLITWRGRTRSPSRHLRTSWAHGAPRCRPSASRSLGYVANGLPLTSFLSCRASNARESDRLYVCRCRISNLSILNRIYGRKSTPLSNEI